MKLLRTKETSGLQWALKPEDTPLLYKRGTEAPGRDMAHLILKENMK